MEVKESEQKRNLKMFLSLLFAVIFLASIVPMACADPGWNYRRGINITNSGSDLTDYQVLVTLNTTNFNYSKANADGSDLRFTNYANSTKYNYWIETWNSSGDSRIWVNVSSVSNGDSKMYMWYNNSAAGSESDGDATFNFFDDFGTDSELDTLLWDEFIAGATKDWSSDAYVEISGSSLWQIRTKDNIESDFVAQFKLNIVSFSGTNRKFMFDIYDEEDTRVDVPVNWGRYNDAVGPDGELSTGERWFKVNLKSDGWQTYSKTAPGDSWSAWRTGNWADQDLLKPMLYHYESASSLTERWYYYFHHKYASPEPTTEISDTEEDVTGPVEPVPELPTIILFSIGLLMLAGYVVIRRKNR
jgi:hypothetical protein